MRLPWRRAEAGVEQTPARHPLADIIECALKAHVGVHGYRRQDDQDGPLGGTSNSFTVEFHHEDRVTVCRIAVYGDSPTERLDKLGVEA